MYNRRLQHKFIKRQALKDDEDPLVSEDVPSDDEWLVTEDVPSADVDMSQPSGSQQVPRKRKRNTRKALQRVDEDGWEDISNRNDSLDISDDDDGGDYSFDPHFKPLDTNDSLWDTLDI
ncbi:hypothetical protein Ddye_005014 [Dipteronia dyeriana]|uniref:Uncharacterized protein n=1 Tax=Dipteronia dyeriana TaxID=168575 RepID=A0AAE0CPB1_9ROSI|nr:hypothetical protein Ddye_005014 [Dipteronia dyeriana]